MNALLLLALACSAPEPLHVRIDKLTDTGPVAPPTSDAEFLRRVTLDFTGRIPATETARKFLEDKSPDKRAKLIDELLAGADYAPALADRLHLMLMERLGDHAEWMKYLRESFAANKPWDVMVREMLRAGSADPGAKGAAFFLAKRLENYGQQPVDYSALTRDVGRLFLGRNFQCCECHDHLTVEEYKQAHFQGLHAFFKNTALVPGAVPQVAEKPTTEKTKFASVFVKVEMLTSPSLPGGMMVEIPVFPKGQEFAQPLDRKTNNPGVPKFSTLASVSELLPTAKNRDFVRNGANRLWFLMMGQGLVQPLDLHHAGNPASIPAVLDLLSEEFVSRKFDIKFMLRELALTKVYQRSGEWKSKDKPGPFTVGLERRLSAEQLFASVSVATGEKLPDTLRAKFVKAHANQPREPEEQIEPSLKAALFVLHDEAVLGLLKAKPGNLAERLGKMDPKDVADELYLSVLTRGPTTEERETVEKFLARNPKDAGVGKLVWALLASVEFNVNH